MKYRIIVTIPLLAGMLFGCDDSNTARQTNVPLERQEVTVAQQPQPQVVYQQAPQQQPQVVVVQQPAAPQPHYDSTGHLITGMVLGHALSRSYNNPPPARMIYKNKTIVVKKYYNSPKKYYGSRSYRRR